MPSSPLSNRRCFIELDCRSGERRTAIVASLTAVMMVAELAIGYASGSMAVLADGLHMGSHAVALCIALFAYSYARRHAHNPQFTFGTGKVNALGGYTGAILLGFSAIWMGWESIERILSPVAIRYTEALAIAVVGLGVNAGSAWILRDDPSFHAHGAGCEHHDHNLRAAYLHVLADAATSVLAIAALAASFYFDARWLDAGVGLAGAVLVTSWALSLVKSSAAVLLDHEGPGRIREMLEKTLERDGDQISDLHCWALAPGRYAAIVSLKSNRMRPAAFYKALVPEDSRIVHLTIEVDEFRRGLTEPAESAA